jgi:hypothetical protein
VCAGFQDNGSWCVPTQTRDTLGIGDDDWMQVGGGDGMWVSTPPGDPHTVYSSYQFGALSRLDLRTGRRDPLQPVTVDAGSEGGYPLTFGWTAPLVQSQHDSATFYFGANRLVRFTRGGRDWELLGPDMTRADRTRPAPDTGSTSYHALFSIAEGPRDRNLLWTGSDDGLIWVSRDAGRTWAEVSRNLPAGAPRACFVGTLVASRHAAGTAYAALDCHHRDDYRPYLYATRDFGATWQALGTGGLPADGGSHTVAEHPVNPGVLFAGTERGAYASVDAGATWRRFPRALPPVPVLRFAVHPGQRDLILATHGRGLWTVNVAPLDSLTPATLAEPARLFPVPPAVRVAPRRHPTERRQPPLLRPQPAARRPDHVLAARRAGRPGAPHGHRRAGRHRAHDPGPRLRRAPARPVGRHARQAAPARHGRAHHAVRAAPRRAGEYVVTMSAAGVRMRQPITLRAWPEDRRGRVR